MLRTALEDLKVVDFTQIGAGPTCTMLLADMGARVIKVEAPEGELGPRARPAMDRRRQRAVPRLQPQQARPVPRPEGAARAWPSRGALIAEADVVIESMRPGVMERLGLGYAQLAADHPRLVYCSISAYGQSGPVRRTAPASTASCRPTSGLMSLIGSPGAEPGKVQAPVVDVVTGYVACVGVLAKLQQRARNGQGG